MTVELKIPTRIQHLVDKDGRLTLEGLQILERMVAMLRDHEARLTAGGL